MRRLSRHSAETGVAASDAGRGMSGSNCCRRWGRLSMSWAPRSAMFSVWPSCPCTTRASSSVSKPHTRGYTLPCPAPNSVDTSRWMSKVWARASAVR